MNHLERIARYGFRWRCGAAWDAMPYGCSDTSPTAGDPATAHSAAVNRGWRLENGIAVCPGHLRAREEDPRP